MKSLKEIETKYDEINKMMSEAMPTEKSNKELASLKGLEALEKMAQTSSHAISLDAQRYILEWVMGQHD